MIFETFVGTFDISQQNIQMLDNSLLLIVFKSYQSSCFTISMSSYATCVIYSGSKFCLANLTLAGGLDNVLNETSS